MKKIVVLGAGLVGGVMADDLSKNHNVTSVDISRNNLEKLSSNKIEKICLDVSNTKLLHDLISDFDLVVGAVPGFMGYKMMKDVIEAKKNIVDISFFPEDPFGLDELAKKNNVIAVMDCGVLNLKNLPYILFHQAFHHPYLHRLLEPHLQPDLKQ